MEKNKTGKYLKYAIGEIVLVVIGILIALSINNWNQKRIESFKENTYLLYIQKEVSGNLSINKRVVINRMDDKIEGLKLAKRFCENDLEIVDTLKLLNKITYGGVFSGGHILGLRNYYDELLSTGKLQLIKNDSIKNAISAYYGRVDYYNDRAKIYSTRFSNYTAELRPYNSENSSYISKYDRMEMIEAFKSIEFRKLVDEEMSYAYGVYENVIKLAERAELINELINKELNDEL